MKRSFDDADLDSCDEETNIIVHGTRCKYIDRIGGLEHGINVKNVLIVSDRRKPKQMYSVYKEWARFQVGMVWVPLGKVAAKDGEEFLRELIRSEVLVSTVEYPFNARNIRISWKTYPLKCVHYDCDTIEEADKYIEENGGSAAEIKTLSSYEDQVDGKRVVKKTQKLQDMIEYNDSQKENVNHKKNVNQGEDGNQEMAILMDPIDGALLHELGDATSHVVRNLFNNTVHSSPLMDKLESDFHSSPIPMRATDAQRDFERKVLDTLTRLCTAIANLNENVCKLRKNLAERSYASSSTELTCNSSDMSDHVTPQKTKYENKNSTTGTPLKHKIKRLLGFPIKSEEQLLAIEEKLAPPSDGHINVNRKLFRSFIDEFHKSNKVYLGDLMQQMFQGEIGTLFSEFQKTELYSTLTMTITSYDGLLDVLPPTGRRAFKWDVLKIEEKVHDIVYRRLRTTRQKVKRSTMEKKGVTKKPLKIATENNQSFTVEILPDGSLIHVEEMNDKSPDNLNSKG